ncbi:interferon alpha-2-like [Corapipo altera]|uniref:interferon alpha-2-like n=1 Tax=Corapipo altera TaxID=415028 RepID=UPI000FD643F6|nr:interferon alpha-2-like [Corapipo altera]
MMNENFFYRIIKFQDFEETGAYECLQSILVCLRIYTQERRNIRACFIMNAFGLIQIGLILLCTTIICNHQCNHLLLQQRKVTENSLQLLDKMGKNFPQRCLREKMSFRFPKQVLQPRQKETVRVAIEEIFQHIFYIFSKNLTLAAWDRTALDQFQNGLYQQIEQLEACVIKKHTHYCWSKEVSRLKLKKYFQKIDCFLKDKQHNLCSWEISRAEMRRCLQLIDKVTRKLNN